MTKKVVFICGSSHSGSTMLDLMISSHPQCFSVGEVSAFFRPERSHHVDPICGCGIKKCPAWKGVREQTEAKVYQTIFKHNPEVNIIIDSSKSLSWLRDQSLRLQKQNIDMQVVLIWKTPLDIAVSLLKRDRLTLLDNIWTVYHKRFISMFGSYISVQFLDLVNKPKKTLKKLCDRIGIDYVEDQESYWNKAHHTLFGSAASRIHLHDIGSPEYKRLEAFMNARQSKKKKTSLSRPRYQTISYSKPDHKYLPESVLSSILSNKELNGILAQLKKFDCKNDEFGVKLSRMNSSKIPPLWYFKETLRGQILGLRLKYPELYRKLSLGL